MRRRRTQLLLVALFSVALLLPAAADARKVGNPGAVSATVTDGSLKVGDSTFNFDDPIVFSGGSVTAAGAISFPASNDYFPPMTVEASGITATVRIRVPQAITGTINPMNGAVSLRLPVWIKIDGIPLGGDCRIASSSSPIVVDPLTTGNEGSLTGTPYNTSNGQARVVNQGFNVPAAESCGPAGGTVNSELGLPTSDTEANFSLQFSPILTKGINASFTATPASGKAPLTTTLNAGATFIPAGVRTCPQTTGPNNCGYRWDFDNNGTVDQTTNTPSTTHTYNTVGTHTAKVTVFDADQDSDSTTRTVTATQPNPDLSINKSHSGDFLVGGQGVYTLSVSNAAGADPTLAGQTTTVTDTLPAGLSFVSASGSGWTCSNAAQLVTCTRTTSIAAGASAPAITVTTTVGAAAFPGVTNSATVTGIGDGNSSNNSDSDPTTVDRIDLGIVKSHDGDFSTGPVETYELQVTNGGTVPTSGAATITDNLPAGLSYVGSGGATGWDCLNSGQAVTCTHADPIPAGYDETIELQVSAGALAVGQLTNTASIATAGDANAANNSSSDPTTVLPTTDLELDKAAIGDFRVGSLASYTLTVTNVGARDSGGTTVVTDTLPAGLEVESVTAPGWDCVVTGQDVSCSDDFVLGAGASADPISIEVEVLQAALPSVSNTASMTNDATGDETDNNPDNDTDTETKDVTYSDLGIDKSHVGGFPVGGQASYTISVDNLEGTAATAGTTTVTDALPAELSYAGATGAGWSCSAAGQDVTCTRAAPIAAGATAPPITLNVAVANTQSEELVNTATVSTPGDIDPLDDSDSDTTALTAADLKLTKSHGSDFRVGTTRAYLLRASNIGSQPTTGTTTVTDVLPEGLTYVSGTGSGWSCGATGQQVTCERSTPIASGANAPTITLQVAVGAGAYPGVTNTALVANDDDRNEVNDEASDSTTVVAHDLSVNKSHVGSLQVGGRASYLIDVANVGTAATNAPIEVLDELPAGLTFVGSPSPAWSCEADEQEIACEHGGAIAGGNSAQTLELLVDVTPSAASEVTNTASIDPDSALAEHDVDSGNDGDGDTADVGHVDLAIEKSHSGDFQRGQEATYTLEVSNVGSDATSAPTRVTDDLPAGLGFAGASGNGWSCSAASGTVSCIHAGSIAGGSDAAPITLTVNVAPDAAAQVTNEATVANSGDAQSANDSDSDLAAVASRTDASISIRPTPPTTSFRVGTDGTYTVAVRNAGTAAIAGPLAASVDLPAGLGYVAASGPGWSCTNAGQAVDCTRAAGLAVDTRTDITVEVTASKQAVPGVTTDAEVSAAGDSFASNDTASASTEVKMIDLALAMQTTGGFGVGGQGAFVLNVENVGSAATISPATISNQLPAGLTFGGASGSGWTCSAAGQLVTCTHPASLAAGAQAGPVTITVSPTASVAGQLVTNNAGVGTADDGEAANDAASSSATVGAAPATPQVLGETKAGGKCKPKKGKKGKKKKCKKKKKKK